MSDLTAVVDGAAPPETATSPVRLAPLLHAMDQYDGPDNLAEMKELAEWLAASDGMLSEQYARKPANIGVAIMQARRLRIPIAAALDELYYDGSGQVAMKASLIQMLVRRAGHAIIIHRTDRLEAVIEIERGDGKPGGTVRWTIDEANLAGLLENDIWANYTADCLFARCVARLARQHAADATGGVVYVPEELQSGYADGGDADAHLTDRTVTEPVAALLDGLETAGHAEVRARWQTAIDQGLLNAYATDGPGGVALTLGTVLRRQLDATMPAPKQRPAPPTSGAPAGSTDSCGLCPVEEVVMTGNHRPDCPRHVDAPAAAEPADIIWEDAQWRPVTPAKPPATRRRKPKAHKGKGKGGRRGGRR
jgi:hypothetical protein